MWRTQITDSSRRDFLGCVGVVACVAAAIVVWTLAARLQQSAARAFDRIDQSLVGLRSDSSKCSNASRQLRITVNDIETSLKDWTQQAAVRRLAEEFKAAEKVERVASTLQQTDNLLELSEFSLGMVNELLAVVPSRGTTSDSTTIDQLLQEIASLRSVCADAGQLLTKIKKRVAEVSDEKSLAERIEQVMPLAARVLSTVVSLHTRLQSLSERIPVAQSRLHELKARTRRWILAGTLVLNLLMVWMAAGQVALVWCHWSSLPWRSVAAMNAVPR